MHQPSARTTRWGLLNLTDAEWRLIEPYLPPPCRRGRPRPWPLREVANAIFHVLCGGIAWRMLPSDLPPRSTVHRWFAGWRAAGTLERMNHALLMPGRERAGRAAGPSAAVLDSQSARTCESGGPRGYDAAKKATGRKRHALVDTDGRALMPFTHPANVQDRDGAGPLLQASRQPFPFIERVFADTACQGERVAKATTIAVQIVRKTPGQRGFAVHPRPSAVCQPQPFGSDHPLCG